MRQIQSSLVKTQLYLGKIWLYLGKYGFCFQFFKPNSGRSLTPPSQMQNYQLCSSNLNLSQAGLHNKLLKYEQSKQGPDKPRKS